MKPLLTLSLLVCGLGLSTCQPVQEPTATTVKGVVINKYTGQPVAGVPVSVTRNVYLRFGGSYRDSVTTAITDAAGHYTLAFDYPAKYKYLVSVLYTNDFYDLTYFPYDYIENGAVIHRGTANKVDMVVTDYKTVTINVKSTKGGKTGIAFSFVNTDQLSYFGHTFFYDTIKAHQNFIFTQKLRMLPHRKYRFDKLTVNRVIQGYNHTFKDYEFKTFERHVLYNDTTTINFY